MRYAYPCVLTPEKSGGYSVSFPDVPEALTCGEGRDLHGAARPVRRSRLPEARLHDSGVLIRRSKARSKLTRRRINAL